MEALKKYMATLTPEEKKLFAMNCGTTLNYLRKVMSTGKPIGVGIGSFPTGEIHWLSRSLS